MKITIDFQIFQFLTHVHQVGLALVHPHPSPDRVLLLTLFQHDPKNGDAWAVPGGSIDRAKDQDWIQAAGWILTCFNHENWKWRFHGEDWGYFLFYGEFYGEWTILEESFDGEYVTDHLMML